MKAKAMILAAGRGERMRPLTDATPKPLLEVAGKPLMQWPLEALAAGGFTEVVVNTAWLGEQIEARYGEHFGERFGASSIAYSHEGRDFGGALETAGGVVRALPLLSDVFWVVAGDIHAPDFRFTREAVERFIDSGRLGHLWLVPNPAHHPDGDFGIAADGSALNVAERKFTFSAIALYRAALFAAPYCDIEAGNPRGVKAPLGPLLREAMQRGVISAEVYAGRWTDVGTPERLAALNLEMADPQTALAARCPRVNASSKIEYPDQSLCANARRPAWMRAGAPSCRSSPGAGIAIAWP
jgi:MurNAc alpha-1-phosphate uridylyltransferase